MKQWWRTMADTNHTESLIFDNNVKKESSCRMNSSVLLLGIISLLSIGLSTGMLIYQSRMGSTVKTRLNPVCVNCNELLPINVPNKALIRLMRRSKTQYIEKCCSEDSEELSAMLESLLTRKKEPASLPSSIVGAHKHLQIFSRGNDPSKTDLSISMKHQFFEYSNEVSLSREGVGVIHPGLYYVYMSLMTFSSTLCQESHGTVTGTLYCKSNGKSTPLFTVEHTCCQNCEHDRITEYSGGLFHLNKEDLIHVNVSSQQDISIGRQVSFMGLTKMG